MIQWTEYGYDVESFANVFTCIVKRIDTGHRWIFEITPWRDHSPHLVQFLRILAATGSARMVGFNNVGYDYPMLHEVVNLHAAQGFVLPEQLFAKNQQIIGAQDSQRFGSTIWKPLVPQLDLYKIHHFDNNAKRTGLKALEFCMRADNVADLPFPVGSTLSQDDIPTLLRYNAHDVNETIKFYHYSAEDIKLRDDLTNKFGRDFTNFSKTKIGSEVFITELEKAAPGSCYYRDANGKRQPRQTFRSEIPLNQVIFPYVNFTGAELNRVLSYMKSVSLTKTKDAPELKDLTASLGGITLLFGSGGIHGSVKNRVVRSDDVFVIDDVDVSSFYPNAPIINRFYPEHLSEKFCDVYSYLYETRKQYSKKTTESQTYKEAMNATYGNSNNLFSPFLDAKYTMTVTINGQLLICMLAEQLVNHVPDLELIQLNTDGLTARYPRAHKGLFQAVCDRWMSVVKFELESNEYRAMFIRDVNNYVAQPVNGKVKRIGAYAFEMQTENPATRELVWHKDWSGRVIAMAASAAMLDNVKPAEFIARHPDPYDFMMRAKVPRSSRLELTDGRRLQNITRYHIATSGSSLVKIMPPLPKKPDVERHMRINVGWSVNVCDHVEDFSWERLERRFYIEETEKLIGML
jgi:hypothetical protein